MLVEALNIRTPDIQFIQMNTDGITIKYNKKYEDKVRKVCKWWEETTKINLEYAYYEKMVIMDVNNYMAVKDGFSEHEDKDSIEKDYVKRKGLFEIDMQYHKNPSRLIIPKALSKYFLHNINVSEYIRNGKNSIFDYCLGVKKKSNFKINLVQQYKHSNIIKEQQKVCRFAVSNDKDSGYLFKDYTDGRKVSRTAILAHKTVKPLYVIKEKEVKNYNINYDYYESETNKLIEIIKPSVTQQKLF